MTDKVDASKNQIVSKIFLNLDDRVQVEVDIFSEMILIFSKIFLPKNQENMTGVSLDIYVVHCQEDLTILEHKS